MHLHPSPNIHPDFVIEQEARFAMVLAGQTSDDMSLDRIFQLGLAADGRSVELNASTGSLHYRYRPTLREQWAWANLLLDNVRRQIGALDLPALAEPQPVSHRELAERDLT